MLDCERAASAVRRAISMRCAPVGFVVVIVPSPNAPWCPCHGHTVMAFFEDRSGVLHGRRFRHRLAAARASPAKGSGVRGGRSAPPRDPKPPTKPVSVSGFRSGLRNPAMRWSTGTTAPLSSRPGKPPGHHPARRRPAPGRWPRPGCARHPTACTARGRPGLDSGGRDGRPRDRLCPRRRREGEARKGSGSLAAWTRSCGTGRGRGTTGPRTAPHKAGDVSRSGRRPRPPLPSRPAKPPAGRTSGRTRTGRTTARPGIRSTPHETPRPPHR